MAPSIATANRVDRSELLEFLRPRHHALLSTARADGRPQMSPVTPPPLGSASPAAK